MANRKEESEVHLKTNDYSEPKNKDLEIVDQKKQPPMRNNILQ